MRNLNLLYTFLLALSVCLANTQANAQDSNVLSPADDAKTNLTRSIKQQLTEQIVPAIESQNQVELINLLSPIIKSSPQQLEAIEDFCKTKRLPSVRTAFIDALLDQIQQGNNVQAAIANVDAVHYVGGELVDKIEGVVAKTKLHTVMKDPLQVSGDFTESEELFWDVHVLHNDLANSQRLVKFGTAITSAFSKKLQLSDEGRDFVAKFETAKNKLTILASTVKERTAELRIHRFNWAKTELDNKPDFKSRFIAAMCLKVDAEHVVDFLKNNKPTRSLLAEFQLIDKINTTLSEADKKHDELMKKAVLLRTGLHYWVRGRYGVGPQVYGMLKHPAAMKSQQVMQALYMPRERPLPISAYHNKKSSSIGFERRHLFTWAAECRPFVGREEKAASSLAGARLVFDNQSSSDRFVWSGLNNETASSQQNQTTNNSTRVSYGKQFTSTKLTVPYRLTGAYEYLSAIENFNRLAAKSSKREIEVYDSLIASQKELAFYSGLATDYGLQSVDTIPESDRGLVESAYQRKSLAWLLALARVEIGATISMYGDSDDPFSQIGMSKFGIREYQEILLDDLSAHLKALETDKAFQNAVNDRKLGDDTMAYLRRARLINDLLAKVMSSQNQELIAAAEPYVRTINDYIDTIDTRIEKAKRLEFALSVASSISSSSEGSDPRSSVESGPSSLEGSGSRNPPSRTEPYRPRCFGR